MIPNSFLSLPTILEIHKVQDHCRQTPPSPSLSSPHPNHPKSYENILTRMRSRQNQFVFAQSYQLNTEMINSFHRRSLIFNTGYGHFFSFGFPSSSGRRFQKTFRQSATVEKKKTREIKSFSFMRWEEKRKDIKAEWRQDEFQDREEVTSLLGRGSRCLHGAPPLLSFLLNIT